MRRNTPAAMLRSPRKDRSGYESLFENEELDDEVELVPQRKQDFLEREVRSDDTLQSIALEYNVTIADLKRVNNIHKENEIFARTLIRIPHKPFSYLLESKFFRNEENVEALAGPSNAPSKVRDEEAAIVELVNNTSISDSSPTSVTSTQFSPADAEETDVLLHTRPSSPDTSPLHCNGVDGDLSWGVLLFVVICIGIGGPGMYIWYFWGHLEKEKGS